MSYVLSFWLILTIMIYKNYWKSIFVSSNFVLYLPVPKSRIKLLIYSLLGSKPNALRTTFKFLAYIVPEPEISKKSNAFLISFFCDAVKTCWLFNIFFLLFGWLDWDWLGFVVDCCLLIYFSIGLIIDLNWFEYFMIYKISLYNKMKLLFKD